MINGKVTQLEQLLCVQEDREAYVAEINDTVKKIDTVKEKIREMHADCKQKEEVVQDKYKEAKRASKCLMRHLAIKNEETEQLQQMI